MNLVYIGENGGNLSKRLKEHKTNCEKDELDKSAVIDSDECYKYNGLVLIHITPKI